MVPAFKINTTERKKRIIENTLKPLQFLNLYNSCRSNSHSHIKALMKSITVITFLLAFTKLTFGQQVIYKPVFIDQCSGLKKDSVSWWLTGSNNQFYAPGILRDDIVVLPDTGEYFLFSENIEMSFSIQDTGIISDTLYTANPACCRFRRTTLLCISRL